MSIKFYPIILLLLVLGFGAQSQTIRGTVRDSSQTIIGATVSISGLKQRAGTDANGKFEIKLPAAGTYQNYSSACLQLQLPLQAVTVEPKRMTQITLK